MPQPDERTIGEAIHSRNELTVCETLGQAPRRPLTLRSPASATLAKSAETTG